MGTPGRPREIEITDSEVLAGVRRCWAEDRSAAAEWLADAQAAVKSAPKNWGFAGDLRAAHRAVREAEQGIPPAAERIVGRPLSKYGRTLVHRSIDRLVAAGLVERNGRHLRPTEATHA